MQQDAPRRVSRYGGERGPAPQHLSLPVSLEAHGRLWPETLNWIATR